MAEITYDDALDAIYRDVDYDPDAGTFTWSDPGPDDQMHPQARKHCAPGSQAGRFIEKHGGYYAITRRRHKIYGSHAAFVLTFGDDRPGIPEPRRGEWVYHLDGDRRNLRLDNLVRVAPDGSAWRVVRDELFEEWVRAAVEMAAVRDPRFPGVI